MKVILSFLITTALLLNPILALADSFNPNLLVSDSRFSDVETLGGPAGIQRFLESRGSVLANTSTEFLLKLREPEQALKVRLPDPRPDLGRLRTAAELIHDAATESGLNPQVILVTLQKEQSLIDGNFTSEPRLQRALDRSLGFGCPDGGSCGEVFLGFYHQLFGNFDGEGNRFIGAPASLMRSFNFEVGNSRVGRGPGVDNNNNAFGSSAKVRTSRVGDTITVENTQGPPNNAQAQSTVTLSNLATAALYRYTPHVYNGNFNFWRFFNDWFRYPNGTLVKRSGDTEIFVIDNSEKRPVSSFVINQRNLDANNIVTLSPTEFSELIAGSALPPLDGTLIRDPAGQNYLIEDGQKKLLSSFVAQQRKFNLAQSNLISAEEIAAYEDGGVALPEEGTLVKSTDSPAVFMITNNQKRGLTGFIFAQRGLDFADVLSAQPGELDRYPEGPILPPADGTLIKANEEPAVYHVANGQLQPLVLFVFNQRGFSFRDVISVPLQELNQWEQGNLMPPETGTLVKGRNTPAVYLFESGVRRPISFAVFINRGFDFADVVVADDSALELFELGEELLLPERSLVKLEDDPTIYWLVDGVMRPLTFVAFQNRRLLFERVIEISAGELAKYEIGAVVEN